MKCMQGHPRQSDNDTSLEGLDSLYLTQHHHHLRRLLAMHMRRLRVIRPSLPFTHVMSLLARTFSSAPT